MAINSVIKTSRRAFSRNLAIFNIDRSTQGHATKKVKDSLGEPHVMDTTNPSGMYNRIRLFFTSKLFGTRNLDVQADAVKKGYNETTHEQLNRQKKRGN